MSKLTLPEEITHMLHAHAFGVLATCSGEYPYTSLISIDFPGDGHHIIFPTLRETRKYTNLIHNGNVSIMLDNRSLIEKNISKLYAITVLGKAREADAAIRPVFELHFLKRHPHLSDFLSLPQTALIQVAFTKLILVEEFEKIREFNFPLQ
jgi:nitroimidazol reductase NimA-like FMN-containing flavoprotein (pyridoxamine 5'-phosphate oxidase superfamily)